MSMFYGDIITSSLPELWDLLSKCLSGLRDFLAVLEIAGRTTGWAFRKEDNRSRALDLDYPKCTYTKLEDL